MSITANDLTAPTNMGCGVSCVAVGIRMASDRFEVVRSVKEI